MEDADRIQGKKTPHPKEKTNFFNRLFFWWQLLLIFGKSKTEDDLNAYSHLKEYDAHTLGCRVELAWLKELKSEKPRLWKVLIKVFGFQFLIQTALTLVVRVIYIYFQPLLLKQLLSYYGKDESDVSPQMALLCTSLMTILFLVFSLQFNSSVLILSALGMKIRVACASLVYRKALRLNKGTFSQFCSVGQLVNLLSNDVNRFDLPFINAPYLIVGPVEIVIAAYNITNSIGYAGMAGIVVLLAILPIQSTLSKLISSLRKKIAVSTDKRIELVNEVIGGVQIIKLYTWEKQFEDMVLNARNSELKQVGRATQVEVMIVACKQFAVNAAVLLCIVVAYITDREIDAQYVFTAYSYFALLKLSINIFMPRGIIALSEAIAAIFRIQEFLLFDEVDNSGITPHVKGNRIEIDNATVKYTSPSAILQNIDFKSTDGELVAVIGASGSGKSTLLHTILKETYVVSGSVQIDGTISYASQESWIFSASVKQNILFGEKMEESRYRSVVKVCGLEHDFALFPFGDLTLVGDRGVMLSGGQKARINLARAIYKKADIYLLDDPLSAVDTQVGKHIFEKCITEYLRDKCVILVTHQIHLLQKLKKVYLLEEGRVAACCSFQELNQIKKFLQNTTQEPDDPKNATCEVVLKKSSLPIEKKEEATSNFSLGLFKKYFAASYGLTVNLILLLLFVVTQLVSSFSDYFLAIWVNLNDRPPQNITNASNDSDITIDEIAEVDAKNLFYYYVSLVIMIIFLNGLLSWLHATVCSRSSLNLHNSIFNKILKGKMKFFSQNPSGRILNRFSKDMGVMDQLFPGMVLETFQVFLQILIVIIVLLVLNYMVAIPALIVFVIIYLFSVFFFKLFRIVRREEATSRSPVFTYLAASMQGLTTIRAFRKEGVLIQEFDRKQNMNCSMYYMQTALMAALGFWMDLSSLLFFVCIIFGLYFLPNQNSTGNIGLMITQAISLINLVQGGIKFYSTLDKYLISVQRVQEYKDLEIEPSGPECKPNQSWLTDGTMQLKSLSLRYSPEEPYVLKDISVTINAKEKIGIIGRTGSGKSSLISTLFRLYDFEGTIFIDNTDIKKLSLDEVRSKIAIIPQEPVLFTGTVRKNLDPFDEYTDEEIWKVLEDVEMKKSISCVRSGVLEGGTNFSVGQKQLLCLARAILRKNKILVLDEATANIDWETDKLIQKLIRNKFQDATVLMIAHRLNTVIDSDKILVMDKGSLVEFDHPHVLLQNTKGYFYQYVSKNGTQLATELAVAAKTHYEQLQN